VALAREHDGQVVVLSVRPVEMVPMFWRVPEPAGAAPVEQEREAADAVREFVERATSSSPVVQIRHGHVVAEILRAEREFSADLVVMGTHGLGGFDRLLLGSVTEKVLRKASGPVLTIPRLAAEPTSGLFRTIVCGVDRSPASARALEHAVGLARESGGRLILVHALEDISAEEPKYSSHFNLPECWREIAPEIRAGYEALVADEARAGLSVEVFVPVGKPYREVLRAAGEAKADLIALGSAGLTAPFGSTTHHVVRDAECPVLSVPPAGAGEPR
jgi:nucleotide-binding universal stress UspA family protein